MGKEVETGKCDQAIVDGLAALLVEISRLYLFTMPMKL
jgi:hypothetical protein